MTLKEAIRIEATPEQVKSLLGQVANRRKYDQSQDVHNFLTKRGWVLTLVNAGNWRTELGQYDAVKPERDVTLISRRDSEMSVVWEK